jgi:hypothetical protein
VRFKKERPLARHARAATLYPYSRRGAPLALAVRAAPRRRPRRVTRAVALPASRPARALLDRRLARARCDTANSELPASTSSACPAASGKQKHLQCLSACSASAK